MNKIFFTLFLFNPVILFTQNFFPVSSGNQYQIYIHNYGTFMSTSWDNEYFRSSEILSDTIIQNQQFFKLSEPYQNVHFPSAYFISYDSIQQKLFVKHPEDDSIRLAVDFNLPQDSTFISYLVGSPVEFRSLGKSYIDINEDSVLVYRITGSSPSWHRHYTFADNIGIYYSKYHQFNIFYANITDAILLSAIIDSTVFNPITLQITNLSPLINRPFNTFPFQLHGEYQTNINLVNTFYVDIIQERDSVEIDSWTATFNSSNYATIYSNDIQPGDKLKLRATVKDYSIYNNVDYFPDSGYAVIEILNPTDVSDNNKIFNYSLEQNFPNPFNPVTKINYVISSGTGNIFVVLKVFDVLGREITTLVKEEKQPGVYEVEFDASGYSNGVYFYQIITEDFSQTKKMNLLR